MIQNIIILCLLFIIIILAFKHRKDKNTIISYSSKVAKPTNNNKLGYGNTCQARALLTRYEWIAYETMKPIADKYNLIICPKVRMINIVEPLNTQDDSLRNELTKEYIDFVICNRSMRVIGVVQLDNIKIDNVQKLRNNFIDRALNDVGYIVVHTHNVTEQTLNPIIAKVKT